jgi:hypothetical protein
MTETQTMKLQQTGLRYSVLTFQEANTFTEPFNAYSRLVCKLSFHIRRTDNTTPPRHSCWNIQILAMPVQIQRRSEVHMFFY